MWFKAIRIDKGTSYLEAGKARKTLKNKKNPAISMIAGFVKYGADDGSRTRFAICISAEKQRRNSSVRKSVRKSAIIFPMTCALYPSPPRCRGGLFLSPRTALLRRGAPCRGTLRQAAVLLLEFLEAVDVGKVFHAVHVLSLCYIRWSVCVFFRERFSSLKNWLSRPWECRNS